MSQYVNGRRRSELGGSYLQLLQISLEKMETFFDSLPFHVVICRIVDSVRKDAHGCGTSFGKKSLEPQLELCLFTEVKSVDLWKPSQTGRS